MAASAATRVAVLADTHLRSGGPRDLPRSAWSVIETCDVILHAGDVLDQGLLDHLGQVATTLAVLGNNDLSLVGSLPQSLQVDLSGVSVAMIHDSGPRAGREVRCRRLFPDADLVVFGHSHVPFDDEGIDGQRLFNPGSPTQRRAQPTHTMGYLELESSQIKVHRIIDLGA